MRNIIFFLVIGIFFSGCSAQLAEFNKSLAEINQSLDSGDNKTLKGKCLDVDAKGNCDYYEGMYNEKK